MSQRQWHLRLGDRALPPLVKAVFHLLWRSCRIESVTGAEHIDTLAAQGQPFIPCYWHQQQIFCARYLLDAQNRSDRPAFRLGYLISPSRDGDLATGMFSEMGAHIIRGSATRGGAQALRDIYLRIKQDGISPIVTPDGPTGPIFEFKPGVAMLAQLSGAPIVPLAYGASHSGRLSSWDRFIIPWPFARIRISIGEPVAVARGESLEAVSRRLGDELNRLSAVAAGKA